MAADRGSRVIRALEQVLSRRERDRAPVRTSRVTGRNEDGTILLQRNDAECVARGGVSDAYSGEVVVEPARSPFARRGTAGIGQLSEQGSVSILWVERLEPDVYQPGEVYDVLVIGHGFTEGTLFEFLRPSGQVNDDITILERTYLDTESFGLSIAVAADAALYRGRAPLGYGNPEDFGATRRKARAYGVDLELEERVEFLSASPFAIGWDLLNDRLLYHRDDWHYFVIKGTEEVYDFGRIDTVICSLAASAGPLNDVAQGQLLALVSSETVTTEQSWSGNRVVEAIAVDPTNGDFAVYSHREDVSNPFVTELKTFTATGGVIAFASIPQPMGDLIWHVPHAVMYDGWIYAIERDGTIWPDDDAVTGRVVKRNVGSPGALTIYLDLPPGERWVFPHSLAYDPVRNRLYVLSTRLNDPENWFDNYETSGLSTLSASNLGILSEQPVDFGFDVFQPWPDEVRPFSWIHSAAGSPNSGGYLIFDGDAGSVEFLSVAPADPSTYDPENWWMSGWTTFRWRPEGPGEHIETLGASLPTPLHRTSSGLIGAFQSDLPPEELDL